MKRYFSVTGKGKPLNLSVESRKVLSEKVSFNKSKKVVSEDGTVEFDSIKSFVRYIVGSYDYRQVDYNRIVEAIEYDVPIRGHIYKILDTNERRGKVANG